MSFEQGPWAKSCNVQTQQAGGSHGAGGWTLEHFTELGEMYHVGQEMEATRGCLDAGQIEDGVSDRGRALDNVSLKRLNRRTKYEDIFLKQHSSLLQMPTGLTAYINFHNLGDCIKVSAIAGRRKRKSRSVQSRPHSPQCILFFRCRVPTMGADHITSRSFLLLRRRRSLLKSPAVDSA